MKHHSIKSAVHSLQLKTTQYWYLNSKKTRLPSSQEILAYSHLNINNYIVLKITLKNNIEII